MKSSELKEELAILFHDNWCSWAASVMTTEELTTERKERWVKCLVEFKDLPDKYKEKARLLADEVMHLIEDENG